MNEGAAVARARLEERIEAWGWFLQLLIQNGYKGQPIWDEATAIAKEVAPGALRAALRELP